jgi:CheY-like chemotaxis protein
MKIMIVDDSASIRQMIRSLLSKTEDDVCECSDGSEALETYTRCLPDWVLMDIRMKKMDGFEATESILARFPDARVVMVTQYDEPELRKRAKEIGVCAFVLKEHLHDIKGVIGENRN